MDNSYSSTADELQAELEALNQQREALSAALTQRVEQERTEFAEEIKAMIQERGYQVEEIVERIIGRSLGRKRRGKRATSDASANYTRYADPDNPANTYTRGRMPNWLSEKMAANGFDPNDAEHRQQFKDQHLDKLAA